MYVRGNSAVHQEAAVDLLAVAKRSIDIGRGAALDGTTSDAIEDATSDNQETGDVAPEIGALGQARVDHRDDNIVRVDAD